jgi:outer membrane protein
MKVTGLAVVIALWALWAPARALAQSSTEASGPLLTLREAERRAETQHPALAIGRYAADAAEARAVESRASLLPQVLLTSTYRYATGNRPTRIGTRPLPLPSNAVSPSPTTLYDYLNAGLTATQLLYDFGQTTEAWRAARLDAESATLDAHAVRLAVILDVRLAFFVALARRELVGVVREDLANQQRHLAQVTALIEVKARPPIDLVQARANVGAAELRRIAAENDYALAKADLDRAMGETPSVMARDDYDIAAAELPVVPGEEAAPEALFGRASTARPDLASIERQIQAAERGLASVRGSYFPSLHLLLSATDAGPMFDPFPFDSANLRWNYSAGLVLAWPIFEGERTIGRVREAEALLGQAKARRVLLEIGMGVEIEHARRTVSAAKTSVVVSATTAENARERLRLAEGRYKEGSAPP